MAARRTFDYSQQLDLFGNLGVDSWTKVTEEAANVREKPARTDDPRTLAEAPVANGRGAANYCWSGCAEKRTTLDLAQGRRRKNCPRDFFVEYQYMKIKLILVNDRREPIRTVYVDPQRGIILPRRQNISDIRNKPTGCR
jgi:hypothetical protein